jgi:transposase
MKKYNLIIPKGETVFVGMDLHRYSWHITVICSGEVIFSGAHPPEPEKLLNFLRRYQPNQIEAVYEAGYFGFSLYELLNETGIQCTVTPPTLLPMEYGNHVKTDRRDSRKLAYLLSKQMLKAVWVPSPELCAHRQVLRRRQQLMGDRVRVQQRIKSELCFFGISIANPSGPWSVSFFNRLKEITFGNSYMNRSFLSLLNEYENLNRLIEQQTQLLKELAASNLYADQVQLLRTIPGIGLISAMYLLLELGDISRFTRAEQLAAYVGLTPAQYSSGENVRMGRITRCGKSALRAILTEVAWSAIKKDSQLREVYENLKIRRGAKKAIVAVARRLLLRCRRVLLDGQPYRLPVAA